MGVTGLSLL